ncbi:MAG: DUF7005 family protein [Blautia sp.]|jgi:hypothetical protein
MEGKGVLQVLAKRYRGLYLPVAEGMSRSQAYKEYVLQGKGSEGTLADFYGDTQDEIVDFYTPEGSVEVICLEKRVDFELFLQKIAYRCEPVQIRPDVGAMMISGVINWDKLDSHRREWEMQGRDGWAEEFRRFTADPENFKDRVLVLSVGPYSNYPPEKAGYSGASWNRISRNIRMYHECCHYVCRRRWPKNTHIVFDEVLADAVGLLGALGHYDTRLARGFLGISPDGAYEGGRLSAYVPCSEILQASKMAHEWINQIAMLSEENQGLDPFDILDKVIMDL